MREILPHITTWTAEHKKIAIATVIDVFNSAPRGIGSKMVVSSDGEMFGSVSAGCVEGAVVEEALQVIKSGKAKRLHYGIEDTQAWGVGLICGGKIDIFVESLEKDDLVPEIQKAVQAGNSFLVATVLEGTYLGKKIILYPEGEHNGTTGNSNLDKTIVDLGNTLWGKYRSELNAVTLAEASVSVFFDLYMPPDRMVIVGATHIAMHLVVMAREMGFHTIVIDPRAAFIDRNRFPQVDEIFKAWPQEIIPGLKPGPSTYLVILTHDAKLDLPALEMGLSHPFRYIGLLGSRPTQQDRKTELLKMGYNEDQLNCIHGPIGIYIGSRLPDEIAVSILAEIIAVRRGALNK
jgi:xanthine dehydrogenase accessory factor